MIRPCPRCYTPMADDALRCPRCGEKMPTYELSFMLVGLGIVAVVVAVVVIAQKLGWVR